MPVRAGYAAGSQGRLRSIGMRPFAVNRAQGLMVYKCLERTLALLLGNRCQLCAGRGATGIDLCQPCRRELPWATSGCRLCARPLGAAGVCGRCQQRPPPLTSLHVALDYRTEAASLVQAFKFRGDLAAGRLLADLLAASWPSHLPPALVPMPLHPRRLRERGFNQATEIARRLPGRILIDRVRRVRATPPQSRLDRRERQGNVRRAFARTGRPLPPAVTLVDDVVTTGASLFALADVLRAGGVHEVHAIAVCRAPPGGR
jgi:ComF family protein